MDESMLEVKCATNRLWSDPMSMSLSVRLGKARVKFKYKTPETGTLPDARNASNSSIVLGKGSGSGSLSS